MSIRDKINELKKKNKEPTKTEVVIPVPKSEWEIDAAPAEVVDNSKFFPREYDPELGINPRQFKYLWNRANALFGSEENLDEAYRNISDQLLEKTGKTKAQVFLAYNDYIIDSFYFRTKFTEAPNGAEVAEVRYSNYSKFYKYDVRDTKNFEAFRTMFVGKDISDREMKTIEGIVKTYEPGYVASKIKARESEYQKQFLIIGEEIEGQWIKGKISKIEPNLPSEEMEVKVEDGPVPPIIPPKGNGR